MSVHSLPILNSDDVSPQLNLIPNRNVALQGIIAAFRANSERHPLTWLDVGGRRGEHRALADGFDYRIMDIIPQTEDTVVGDICSCPEIDSDQFDVVSSFDVFEHVNEPWRAAEECVRITRPGGLLIHVAPFAWRYHPFPQDMYRFTAQGLAYLFERSGQVTTELSGYDISMRRRDMRGIPLKDNLDVPPVDALGGWREHWWAVWVGRKHA